MTIRTVNELKDYLDKQRMSPETIASQLGISNMTVRRFLRRKPAALIPAKYHVYFDCFEKECHCREGEVLNCGKLASEDFGPLLHDLEIQGSDGIDTNLNRDIATKLNHAQVNKSLRIQVPYLLKTLKTEPPARLKALAVGALLYFINPFDLIPDASPIVGYLDDCAVLALVISVITAAQEKKTQRCCPVDQVFCDSKHSP